MGRASAQPVGRLGSDRGDEHDDTSGAGGPAVHKPGHAEHHGAPQLDGEPAGAAQDCPRPARSREDGWWSHHVQWGELVCEHA